MTDDYGFWDNFLKEATLDNGGSGSIDSYLSGKEAEGPVFSSVQALTDVGRAKNALELPVKAGTRVSFAGQLGAVLAYNDAPEPKAQGVVVEVKSAGGDITAHDGLVFVQWDDGKMRPTHVEHLRLATGRVKRQAAERIRVASLGDLTDFMKVADDTLVHRSTKDLWSMRKDGEDFVIERLFDSAGDPIKA